MLWPDATFSDPNLQGVKVEGDRVKEGRVVKKTAKKKDQANREGKPKKEVRPSARPDNFAITKMNTQKKRVNREEIAGHVPGIPPNYRSAGRMDAMQVRGCSSAMPSFDKSDRLSRVT